MNKIDNIIILSDDIYCNTFKTILDNNNISFDTIDINELVLTGSNYTNNLLLISNSVYNLINNILLKDVTSSYRLNTILLCNNDGECNYSKQSEILHVVDCIGMDTNHESIIHQLKKYITTDID